MRHNTTRPTPTVQWRSEARKTKHHALHGKPKGKGITARFHGETLTEAARQRSMARDYWRFDIAPSSQR